MMQPTKADAWTSNLSLENTYYLASLYVWNGNFPLNSPSISREGTLTFFFLYSC